MKRTLIAIALATLTVPVYAQNADTSTDTTSTPAMSTNPGTVSTPSTSGAYSSTTDSEYARWSDNPADRRGTWIPGISYGYVGGGGGTSFYHAGCSDEFSCDRRDNSWSLFTGGQFSRIFGVELGYVNLGDAQVNGGDLRAQGVDLDLVANLPLGRYFNLFAKGGGIYGWTHSSNTLVLPGTSGNDDGVNWDWGLGAQLDVNRNWALRLDWDRYRFDYATQEQSWTSAWTANVVFKF